MRLHDTQSGRASATWVVLRDRRWLANNSDGHYCGSPGVEDDLAYVVQTDQGQETLTAEQFSSRYGWKNNPEKARITLDATGKTESPTADPATSKPVDVSDDSDRDAAKCVLSAGGVVQWKALKPDHWDLKGYFGYNQVPQGRPWPNRYQENLRKGMGGRSGRVPGRQEPSANQAA